jgi:hypothetical protein
MEGSYDKVWSEMKSERVPSEEFAIFSEVRKKKSPYSILPSIQPPIHPSNFSLHETRC